MVVAALAPAAPAPALASDADVAGASILVTDGATRDSASSIHFTLPRGAETWRLERRIATYGGGACAAYGGWSAVGDPNPVSPTSVALTNHSCSQYRLVVAGETVATSNREVRTDRTAPTGSVDVEVSGVVGSAVGLATDSGSGRVLVDVLLEPADAPGDVVAVVCDSVVVSLGMWGCPFDASELPAGTYAFRATLEDDAGNVRALRRTWTWAPAPSPEEVHAADSAPVDTIAPVVTSFSAPAVALGAIIPLAWSVQDASGGEPHVQLQVRRAGARGGWSAWRTVHEEASSPFWLTTPRGGTTCMRLVVADLAGNTSSSGSRCTSLMLDDRVLASGRGWARKRDEVFGQTFSRAPVRGGAALRTQLGGWTKLAVVATTCPRCGVISVRVGARVAFVSLRSTATKRKVLRVALPAQRAGGSVSLAAVDRSGRVDIDGLVVTRAG